MSHILIYLLAGMEGFEPPNASTKNWCLTTWRHPINKSSTLYLKNTLKTTSLRYNKHMRVIEPHKLTKPKPKKVKGILLVVLGFVLVGIFSILMAWRYSENHNPFGIADVLGQQGIIDKRANAPETQDFRYFAPPEFQQLNSTFIYPNTQMITTPPKITGNITADARLRVIAESRGFELHAVPVASIMKVDDTRFNLLQEKALNGWSSLRQAAEKDGVALSVSSGYRSIETQREMFLQKLKNGNISVQQIANGQADNRIVAILQTTAIPGYSRHHTGYTIDVSCGDAASAFEDSSCYGWISKDNYLNAKKSGWIPSFPEGANNYGPEPEPAEFVWVGKQAVLKE